MSKSHLYIKQTLSRAKAYKESGNIDAAKECYLGILHANPKNSGAIRGLKKLPEKAPSQIATEQLDKELVPLIKLHSAGKLEEALPLAEQFCKSHPQIAKLHHILGVIQIGVEQLTAGIASLGRALQIDPELAEAHNALGVVLKDQRNFDLALACFDRALKINPQFAHAYSNRGLVLKSLNKFDAAIESYQQAISILPSLAEAHNNLGIAYANSGKIKLAEECYLQSIKLNPGSGNHYNNFSRLHKYVEGDKIMTSMENYVSNPDTSSNDKKHFYFALAKAYEDIESYDQSFHALELANAIRKDQFKYQLAGDQVLNSETIRHFTENPSFGDVCSDEDPGHFRPIFVLGMPRSGTTLVEQILSSHSLVYGAGELIAINKLTTPVRRELCRKIFNHEKSDILGELRTGYLENLASLNVRESVIVDKMPLNFRWIGFILAALPGAKIVNLNRDPIATCWSIFKHHFAEGNGFSFDIDDLVGFYKLYRELMSFWRKRYPDRIYDLNYEKLTYNQEPESRNLLAYCGLEWEDQCLDFQHNQRAVATASTFQVRKGMYQGSSEAWRKYEAYIQPLVSKLEKLNLD